MNIQDLGVHGNTLVVRAKRFALAHPVADAFFSAQLIVVMFDPDSVMSKYGQFANLVALDPLDCSEVWKAELPSTTTGDRYYKIASRDPLVVYSVTSFVCTIDPSTGRIEGKEFVK